jgi:uncharacterized protein HemY
VSREPGDFRSRNNLAWLLASRAGVDAQEANRAIKLAKEAVALAPENGTFWNTLGVACYRAKDWNGAISALEQSMRLRGGGDPYDWLFIAMVRHCQGQRDAARQWYDRALAWLKANPPRPREELGRIHAEASGILGIEKASLK